MRGMFTAGVTDVLMEQGIEFDAGIGVSAGAVFGCNIKSRQIGRAIRYNLRFCKEWRYCSVRSLLFTGDLYGADFCYNRLPYELDLFDLETYAANPMKFYVVCTEMQTGQAAYQELPDGGGVDMDWFRASASMPVASRPVRIGDKEYLDGGISDSIPLAYMEGLGYDRNVVVLTQPEGYRKGPLKMLRLIRFLLRKYPAVCRALETRPDRYNEQLAYVEEKAKAGEIFVIRPPEALGIGPIEHDPEEKKRVYEIGRRTMEEQLEGLKAFLAAGEKSGLQE